MNAIEVIDTKVIVAINTAIIFRLEVDSFIFSCSFNVCLFFIDEVFLVLVLRWKLPDMFLAQIVYLRTIGST